LLVAVNKENTELIPANGNWVCSQGKLLLALEKDPTLEVFIDKELPGALHINELINVIKKKYPEAKVSLIYSEKEKIINKAPSFIPYLAISLGTGLLVLLLFFLMSKDLNGNSLFMKNLFISIGIAMTINFGAIYALQKGGGEQSEQR
jgi:hypothetical protein